MKRRLKVVLAVAALAGVGCGDVQQAKQAQPEPEPRSAVGKDIPFPAIIAKDLKGRKYEICTDAQAIVKERVKPAQATFPDCIDDPSQVQYLGDGHYTIRSWAEIALARTKYSGEAVITEENGVPRSTRITRLDLEGDAK